MIFGEVWPQGKLTDPQKILSLISSPAEPSGLYNLLYADDQSVRIVSDRYRVYPIYIWQNQTDFIISNNLGILVETVKPEPDFFRIKEKLLLGYPESSSTIWKGITRLGFLESVLISPGKFEIRKNHFRLPEYSLHDREQELYDLLTENLKEQSREPETTFALTGGSDSRLTFSFLIKNKINRRVFTHGQSSSHDVILARMMAKAYQFKSVQKIWKPDWLKENGWKGFDSIQHFSPGSNDLSSSHFVDSYQFQKSQNFILVDSTAAEMLSRVVFPAVTASDSSELVTEKVIRFLAPGSEGFLNPPERDQIRQSVFGKINQFRSLFSDARTAADLYYLYEKSFNQDTCTFQVHHFVTRMPYLDQRFLDLATGLDPVFKVQARLHNRWIRRNAPGLAWFPLDHAGELKLLVPNLFLKKLVLAPQRAINKLTGQRKHRYILHYDEWISQLSAEWIQKPDSAELISSLFKTSDFNSISPSVWNRVFPVLWALQNQKPENL